MLAMWLAANHDTAKERRRTMPDTQENAQHFSPAIRSPEDAAWAQLQTYLRGWVARHSIRSDATGQTYAHGIQRVLPDILASGGFGRLTTTQVSLLLDQWKTRMSASTWNGTLSALAAFWTDARDAGLVQGPNPFASKHRPVPERVAERILTEVEVKRLIANAAPGRDRTFIRFLYATGLRISEAVGLTWTHFRPQGDTVYATFMGKGGKTRTVRVKPAIWDAVTRDCRGGDGPFPFSRYAGYRIVHAAARRAGLGDRVVSPHVLRHSHATHAIEHGAPMMAVKEQLGHARLDTTQIYVNLQPGPRSEAYLPDL